ncbi:MAG: hypothetical protein AAF628_03235 [Planctomycetota bacterium]
MADPGQPGRDRAADLVPTPDGGYVIVATSNSFGATLGAPEDALWRCV